MWNPSSSHSPAAPPTPPGPDIDAVALIRKGQTVGYVMKGSAVFLEPASVACTPRDCSGQDCTYASSSSTIPEADLISRTEGPPDAVVRWLNQLTPGTCR